MIMAEFQYKLGYGHSNLNFVLFSGAIKSSSFDFSQPFKNEITKTKIKAKNILSSRAVQKQVAS